MAARSNGPCPRPSGPTLGCGQFHERQRDRDAAIGTIPVFSDAAAGDHHPPSAGRTPLSSMAQSEDQIRAHWKGASAHQIQQRNSAGATAAHNRPAQNNHPVSVRQAMRMSLSSGGSFLSRGSMPFVSVPSRRPRSRRPLARWDRSLRRLDRVATALKRVDVPRECNWAVSPNAETAATAPGGQPFNEWA